MAKRIVGRMIPAKLSIADQYFHCAACLKEKPANLSPRQWSMIEAGWTELGFQVWCRRHGQNIAHIDFQGMQHPANLSTEDFKPSTKKEQP